MYIEKLFLKNFRNHKNSIFEFSPELNIILGNNGVGKTNILEAITVISNYKSFKGSHDSEIINWNENSYFCSALVKEHAFEKFEIGCVRNLNILRKKGKINGQEINKLSDYYGKLLTVILSPSDITIINGPPESRRKFIDSVIAKINNNYIKILNDFKKILYSRNQTLKNLKIRTNYSYNVIEPWDKLFSEKAAIIQNIRRDFIKKYASHFMNNYTKISNSESPQLNYLPNIQKYDAASINMILQKNFKRDIMIGSTGIGPQRDEFTLLNKNKKKFTSYASQGERRTAAVSLKVAEKDIIENYSGKKSIILLDDIFSELDNERKKSLIKNFKQGNQIIFTMVENYSIDESTAKNIKIFNM